MTKEITKASILQEIQEKFQLRDFEPEKFLFGEYVMPIYDIGTHVKRWENIRYRLPVTANGSLLMTTVPDNEIWHIRRISFLHEAGANFDVDQFFASYTGASVQYFFYDTAAPISSGTVKIFEFPQDIVMEAHADSLQHLFINVANFVAGGNISLHVLKEVETIR